MNSKLLCLASKNFRHRHEKLVLDVLLFDNLSRETVKVFEENVDDFGVVIEDNCSKRISVFDKRSFILKVYEFDGANVSCLEVNLSQYAKDFGSLLLNRFMMGKVMLIHCSDVKFKCILVNEDGTVVEGIDQQWQKTHAIYPAWNHAFHVNADGIVAIVPETGVFNCKVYFYN